MEWDDERSGGFEPLRFLPKGEKQVVLGLVTTKRGELESKDELKRRIEEASTYAPHRAALPLAAVRLLVDGRGQRAQRGGAVGEAAPDRRGRRGSLGLTEHRPRRDVRRLSPSRPDDAVLEPGLDRGAVPRRACRTTCASCSRCTRARSSGSRPGTRSAAASRRSRSLHTTAGLGNAVGALATARVNRAPLVVVVGQQDRRHLVFEPFLAGRLDGPRGRLPGLGRPARARAGRARRDRPRVPRGCERTRGPALVVVPMDDWSAPVDEEREDAAAGRVVRCGGSRPGRGRRARRVPRRRGVAGARRRRGRRRRGDLGGARRARASGSSRRCSRSRSARVRGSRRTTRSSRASCPADRPRLREKLAPYDARARRRRARVPPVAVRAGAASPTRRRGSRSSATTRTRCTAARSSSPCSRRRPRSAASSRDALPQRDAAAAAAVPPAARLPTPSRAADARATCSRRSPSACRATRSSSRRRPSTGPELHDRLARARAARLPQRRDGRPRLRARRRDRRADGAARPAGRRRRRRRLVDLRDPGALERRALRRRRPVRDPLERRLRDHGPPRRAPRRAAAVAGVRRRRRGARPRLRLSRRVASRRTTSSSPRSTTSSRRSRRATAPLLLDVVIAPDADVRAVRRETPAAPSAGAELA